MKIKQHIYLEGNNVKKLDDEFFTTFQLLKWFDIRNNQLSEIPKTIVNHPCLQVLLLEGNRLEQLPLELGSIPNLRGLQLTRNPLCSPPKSIINKGSAAVIEYLQKEWLTKNSCPERNISLQSCHIRSAETKSIREAGGKRHFMKKMKFKTGKTVSQPLVPMKAANSLKDCVRVTKLVRSKPRTSVTLFNEWNTFVNQSNQLQSEEIEGQEQSSFKKTITSPSFGNSEKKSTYKNTQQEVFQGLLVKPKTFKDTWQKRIRDVIAKQEAELQKKRDKDVLQKWQSDTKDQQVKKWAEYVQGEPLPPLEVPYDTEEKYKKMPSRSDIEKVYLVRAEYLNEQDGLGSFCVESCQTNFFPTYLCSCYNILRQNDSKIKRKPSKSSEFNSEVMASKINNSILEVLQQLRKARSARTMNSSTEKQNLASEIRKINELQRTLSALKVINFKQLNFS